ncbi:MAG: 3-keto-disaccharide hydrolase [Planctomycetota bacterium]
MPNGGTGWLGITQEKGDLQGAILWGGGSVKPVNSINIQGDRLVITRIQVVRRGANKGKRITETITATLSGDNLKLVTVKARSDGRKFGRAEFTGKRTPPLPPRPDLSKLKLGAPITLFNGKNLDGWRLTNPKSANGWIAEGGVLVNRPTQPKGKQHVSYGNLRTIEEFKDFKLTFEVNVPEKSNSGVYLRGIYELQVLDSYGKPLSPHNMGAIYSRITPAVSAEKPARQWQAFDVTLLDRHVTVVLNGKRIIDNKPLLGCTGLGCTGGALWSDPLRPGPLYLQGNHGAASFRNIVLTPILKE